MVGAQFVSRARYLRAMTEVSLQGKLVHRRFQPLFANTALAALLGYDGVEEVLAQEDLLAHLDEDTRADPASAWTHLAIGLPINGRRTLRRRDGAPFRAEILARRVDWEGGPAVAMAILDISREEAALRDLKAAELHIQAATRAKHRLLSAASHELRTPLHAAMGRLQLLTQTDLAPRPTRFAQDALRSCQVLLHHIDDILDAAALESGAIPLVREPFPLREALVMALETAQESVGSSEAALRLALRPGGPDRFIGDERRVRRLALALWEEAARRSSGADVALQVEASPEGLSFAIQAPDPLAYAGLDAETAAGPPARIAETLAKAMGGVMRTHMTTSGLWEAGVFLPLAAAAPMPAQAMRGRLDILVVEDNPGNRALLKLVLEKLGHRPHLAPSGVEGVSAVAARSYDLVLMDLSMPGMDGFEAARAIRKLDRPWARLPIAALTASCAPGVQEAVAEAGMDAFLQKPVDLRRLAEAIQLLAQPEGGSIQPAELDGVEGENHHDETNDKQERRHAEPQV